MLKQIEVGMMFRNAYRGWLRMGQKSYKDGNLVFKVSEVKPNFHSISVDGITFLTDELPTPIFGKIDYSWWKDLAKNYPVLTEEYRYVVNILKEYQGKETATARYSLGTHCYSVDLENKTITLVAQIPEQSVVNGFCHEIMAQHHMLNLMIPELKTAGIEIERKKIIWQVGRLYIDQNYFEGLEIENGKLPEKEYRINGIFRKWLWR